MNDDGIRLQAEFSGYFESQIRRVLTQLDRDPQSKTYGCFDRNFWHYKIRDFPSSILQQGSFLLEQLRIQDSELVSSEIAGEWALSAVNALSHQVGRKGDVSEYYPYEDSYPASAFGLYCATRISLTWIKTNVSLAERIDWQGLRKLAKHLIRKKELNASNQFAAALAGLAMGCKLPEIDIEFSEVEALADEFFALQHDEGWFYEYGGPDFGYLTVTIDALVDYYEITGDSRALSAIDKAVDFLCLLVGPDGQLPWTLNARNTDYVVPYGLVRTASRSGKAAWLVNVLFSDLNSPNHNIWATDDRYHLHYIFSSIARSVSYLKDMVPALAPKLENSLWLPGCGYFLQRDLDNEAACYVGAKKGGVVRIHRKRAKDRFVDHGYRLYQGRNLWTSNWWQNPLKVVVEDDQIVVKGKMVPVKPIVSSVFKHQVLRWTAFCFGQSLIGFLKRQMIFRKSKPKSPLFQRKVMIDFQSKEVRIVDNFQACRNGFLYRSPRQNLRHVASANSFHKEDVTGMQRFLDQGAKRIDPSANSAEVHEVVEL